MKAKTSAQLTSQNVQSIWMEFGLLLRLVSLLHQILFDLVRERFKGENPSFVILFTKKVTCACILTYTKQFTFKVSILIETS